jgi:hypothetical protein
MKVELSSTKHDRELESEFGRPRVTQHQITELVGAYHVMGDTLFWFYNPLTESWSVLTERSGAKARLNIDLIEADRSTPAQDWSMLAFMPPPDIDKTPKFFVHDGWLWRWKREATDRVWTLEAIAKF